MKTTAIYLRVSTDKQDGQAQRFELEQYIRQSGFTDCVWYEDLGCSGRTDKRPQLQRLLADCRRGQVSRVLVWKFDRMFRSLRHLLNICEEFSTLNIQFIAVKNQLDLLTSQGKFMMQMLGAFAEFECEMIRERVRAGMRRAKQCGTRSGRPIGRPRQNDFAKIIHLRKTGLTYDQISRELNVSIGAIQRALKA